MVFGSGRVFCVEAGGEKVHSYFGYVQVFSDKAASFLIRSALAYPVHVLQAKFSISYRR